MSINKFSNQEVKMIDFNDLNLIKSELFSKINEVNKLLKTLQEKGVSVDVENKYIVINDGLLTQQCLSSVMVNLSIQI